MSADLAIAKWQDADPAHRGAVLLRLAEASANMRPTPFATECSSLSTDIAEQNMRKAALSSAFDAAIALLIVAAGEAPEHVGNNSAVDP